MILKPFYLSAPSRSGSSLLIRMLNCITGMAVVNEPVGSVDIANRNNIRCIFESLECDLKNGFIRQRVGLDGSEVTDTFPPTSIKWGKVSRSFEGMEAIGIKKSFPAFSNKDYFVPFSFKVKLPPPRYKRIITERGKGGRILHSTTPER